MGNLEKQLVVLFEKSINALGFELLGVELVRIRTPLLRVYIDSQSGLSVEDCADVSRQISAILDVEDPLPGAYTLEVSSPGLDRPLFTIEQYERFIGDEVVINLRVALANRRKWQGTIKQINGRLLTLTIDGQDEIFAFDNIERANVVPKL